MKKRGTAKRGERYEKAWKRLEVGRAGTMEVKATKGAESTKARKKQTGGDLRGNKR